MEKCYEYFGCEKKDCVMYENKSEAKCWDVQGTLCTHPTIEHVEKMGIDKCKYCIYYKSEKK